MWGVLQVLGVWCLVGVFAESGQSVMGGLYWCNPLCMCSKRTNVEVQCFEREQLYEVVGITKRQARRLGKNKWYLEERLDWCSDLCLCHKHNQQQFQCADEEDLITFISDNIGDGYFYDTDEEVVEEIQSPGVEGEQLDEIEEETEEPEHSKRSERRRNKKNRKQRKKERQEEAAAAAEREVETSEAPATLKPQPEPEPEPESEPEPEPESEPEPEPEPTPYHAPEPIEPTTTTTAPSPSPPVHLDEVYANEMNEERGEPLPKQEAVAASPAVTALQPPTRRQPFPTTVESYTPRASPREVEMIPPRVQPVLEVPKEKKTVASKVSQDLDELGSTVLEIKSDVVLNQRILLVTVAIAGIAMLGVLVLAIHGCSSRRHPPQDQSKKRDAAKDDNHVTKLNMEEAW